MIAMGNVTAKRRRKPDAQLRDWPLDQHEASSDHRMNAAERQNSVTGHRRFQHEQNDRQNDQCSAGPIDRKHVECKQRQNQADRAEHAGRERSRDGSFRGKCPACRREQGSGPDSDPGPATEFSAGRHFELFDGSAAQLQGHGAIVDPADLLAVVLIDYALDVGNDGVDQIVFQRFFGGKRTAFGDRRFRQSAFRPRFAV